MNLTDQINSLNPLMAGQTMFAITSGLQDHHPAAQVAASAMFLRVMCEEFQLNLTDVLSKAGSILLDTDQFTQKQFSATLQLNLEEYLTKLATTTQWMLCCCLGIALS
jgi:hypothetical protein